MEETKTSKIYNYKNRIIIRALLTIFTIITVVFGSLGVYVLSMVGPSETFSSGKVETTSRYQDLIDMEVQILRGSLEARKPFETNGELDASKTIDIMNPQETDEKKQNKNTTFTVEDITNMNRQMVFDGIDRLDTNLMARDGDTGKYWVYTDGYAYYNGSSEEQIPGILSEEQHIILLAEEMKTLSLAMPISGKPLMEYAQNNQDGITPIDVFESLIDLRRMMSNYDDLASQSSRVGTNLRYYIKDNETNQIITNGNWKSVEGAEKGAKARGLLIACKRDAKGGVINEESTAGFEMAKHRMRQEPLISKSEEVVITVDQSYPAEGQLSQFRDAYNSLKPYFIPFLVWAIIGLIGMIVCFILVTITTGQSEKKGEVRLNIFDRIPTEIGASMVCLFGLVALGANIGIYDMTARDYGNTIVNVLYMVGMLMIAMLIATWGYLSLVRRIKAKNLWKNSLCRRILNIIKKAYYAGKMSVRLVISFFLLTAGHVFMIALFRESGLIVLIIADAVILVRLLKEVEERQRVKDGLGIIAAGDLDYKLDTTNLQQDNKEMAEAANQIADGLQSAVEKSMKNERMRSELITNVSHDIKTPLTSIINYVDLLKREDIQNPQVKGYIDILDAKSQRLKHLTEDLVEASKVSSGNIELHMDNLFVQELLQQAEGEFSEKLKSRKLELVSSLAAEPVIIKADGRQLWRIFENLLNNIAKYALEGTRVYVDLTKEDKKAVLIFKNMSQEALNINADELTERFVRGDISRTTEGSGLGLSIAKSLTELQGGQFDIYLDGDLFKVTLTFDMM